tara:strand:+ start:447 stop:656 length:210 start_codon:yes stop_codon:yes gene_type:complete
MNQDLKNKLVALRIEAETDMVYYRNRMNECIDEGHEGTMLHFQAKFNEAKSYFKGLMDTLNLIAQDQAK